MATDVPPKPEEHPPQQEAAPQQLIPPEAAQVIKAKLEEKLDQVPAPQLVAEIFAASMSRTVGPDPETAKLMAQTEMHAETSKLEAYKTNLENRNEQGKRDHEFRTLESNQDHAFRKKELNHQTVKALIIIVVALAFVGSGLYLVISGGDNRSIGTNILIAGVAIMVYAMTGRMPSIGGKE
jgi:hypothetical protein